MWNDPDVGVEWPIQEGMEILLSEKDKKNTAFRDLESPFVMPEK